MAQNPDDPQNMDAAFEVYYYALQEHGDHIPLLLNGAVLADQIGQSSKALKWAERAHALDPNNVTSQFMYAILLLTHGQWKDGWPMYENRIKRPVPNTFFTKFKLPFWKGEDIKDKRLLVWKEQGLGDQILYSSVLQDALNTGAKLSVIVEARLVPIFAQSFPDAKFIAAPKFEETDQFELDESEYDYQASFPHLCSIYRTDHKKFPANQKKWLASDEKQKKELYDKYRSGINGPLIGISWDSNSARYPKSKSIGIKKWEGLLTTPGLNFVSLQYGDPREDIEWVKENLCVDIQYDKTVDPLVDMHRFAAQVDACDMVISVSNTTVHMAGALGKSVVTLVPFAKGRCWYWGNKVNKSLWYPTMTLVRGSNKHSDGTGQIDYVREVMKQFV